MYGKVMLIADPHIGDIRFPYGDDSGLITRLRIQAFRRSIEHCLAKKSKYLIVLGDMFNPKSLMLHPDVIKEIRGAISYGVSRGLQVLFIAGNHEISSKGSSSLNYLEAPMVEFSFNPGCVPLQGVTDRSEYVLTVPYIYNTTVKDILTSLEDNISKYKPKILLGHFGVAMRDSSFFAKDDPWYVDINFLLSYCKSMGIKTCVLGHQHSFYRHTMDGVTICCLGALSPTAKDQLGYCYGNVGFLDVLDGSLDVDFNAIKGYRYTTSKEVCKSFADKFLVVDAAPGSNLLNEDCIPLMVEEPSNNLDTIVEDIAYDNRGILKVVDDNVENSPILYPKAEAKNFLDTSKSVILDLPPLYDPFFERL